MKAIHIVRASSRSDNAQRRSASLDLRDNADAITDRELESCSGEHAHSVLVQYIQHLFLAAHIRFIITCVLRRCTAVPCDDNRQLRFLGRITQTADNSQSSQVTTRGHQTVVLRYAIQPSGVSGRAEPGVFATNIRLRCQRYS